MALLILSGYQAFINQSLKIVTCAAHKHPKNLTRRRPQGMSNRVTRREISALHRRFPASKKVAKIIFPQNAPLARVWQAVDGDTSKPCSESSHPELGKEGKCRLTAACFPFRCILPCMTQNRAPPLRATVLHHARATSAPHTVTGIPAYVRYWVCFRGRGHAADMRHSLIWPFGHEPFRPVQSARSGERSCYSPKPP